MSTPGRPAGPTWPALRRLLSGARPEAVRPLFPWTTATAGACDRYGHTLIGDCGGCNTLHWAPLPCMKSDCPRCADRVAARRGERALEAVGGPEEIGVCIVTFPSELRRYLSTPAVLREVEDRIVSDLRCWSLTSLGGDIGGRSVWHPCGDVCDSCGRSGKELALFGVCPCGAEATWKPHLNIVVPGVVLTPSGDHKPRHLFLTPRQIEALRGVVRLVLEELLEICGERAGAAVNVFWQYRKTLKHKSHALRYFLRPFPAWPALRQRPFGLLAGPSERARAYRAAVHRPTPDKPKPLCPCCNADNMAIYVAEKRAGAYARATARRWEEILADYGS